MIEVSPERISEVMLKNSGESFGFSLSALDVILLHGLIKLALNHPGVGKRTPYALERGSEIQLYLRSFMLAMGFSVAECDWLDKTWV